MNDNVRRVVEVARSWQDRDFWKARYGVYPFCASFVRYVFEEALGKNGELPVVRNPPLYRRLKLKYPVGRWYADSMAGNEVGPAVPRSQMAPGDVLLFRNTYGYYKYGTITHVGVCVDAGGTMADAGSGGIVHVRSAAATFGGKLIEVRRPWCLGEGIVKRTRIAFDGGTVRAMNHGVAANHLDMEVHLDGALHPVINGREVRCRYATVDVAAGDRHVKLFYHDKRARAFANGTEIKRLDVGASLNGGLHVRIDGKEVKPTAARLEII